MNLSATGLLGTLGVGAGLTALIAGWQQVRGLLARLLGIVIVTIEVRDFLTGCTRAWVQARTTRTPPWLSRSFLFYVGRTRYVRPKQRQSVAPYEEMGDRGRLVFWNGRPLWVQERSGDNGGGNRAIPRSSGDSSSVMSIRYLRGTIDPDKLVFDLSHGLDPAFEATGMSERKSSRFAVIRLHGASNKGRQGDAPDTPSASKAAMSNNDIADDAIYRLVGYKKTDIGEDTEQKNPVARLSLTPEVDEMLNGVRRWYKAKEWYTARQIPWRRGALFHGTPGTGKSSLAKAIAQELGIPIYLLDISTMDNQEFHSAYRSALRNAPCMVLIEDIDAVFHGRENVASELGKGLTFDCLLNTISGVETSDGVLLIITTNHLDQVDPALGVPQPGSLSSRPGRIDCAVELPILTYEGRVKLAQRILEGCHPDWVPYLVNLGKGDTGAQFEDRCANIALALFWSNDPKQPVPAEGCALAQGPLPDGPRRDTFRGLPGRNAQIWNGTFPDPTMLEKAYAESAYASGAGG